MKLENKNSKETSLSRKAGHLPLQRGAFFFLFFILPSSFFILSAHASLGEDLNSLLDRFFGSKKSLQKIIEPRDVQVPEIVLPENPTVEDVAEFQKKIEAEEKELADFTERLDQSRARLWETEEERVSVESQLQALDQELGFSSQRLEKLEEQTANRKKELEILTRENSNIKALLRVREKELDTFLKKNYIREQAFGGNGVSALKWLLSGKSVSEILEERQLNKKFVQEKKGKLMELGYLKQKVGAKEAHSALLYHQIDSLKANTVAEKKGLSDVAGAKAHVLARLEFSEGTLQKETENYERQRMESEVFLQNLHTALREVSEKAGVENLPVSKKEEPILSFPLNIPLRIMAGFGDPKYKQRMKHDHVGVDFYAPQGTEIFAPRDGIVKKIGDNARGYGYAYFILDHGKDLFTVYGHVSDILVNEGQEVKKGDIVALTGGTPGMKGSGFFTTGPHLHLEVFQGGKHTNPLSMMNGE